MMLRKGKLPLLPARSVGGGASARRCSAGPRRRRQAVSYAFFPGCSLEGTAKDFHRSTLAVAPGAGPGAARDRRTGSAAARPPPTAAIRCWPTPCRRKNLLAAARPDGRGGLRRLLQPAEDGQPPHRRRRRRARQSRRRWSAATTTAGRRCVHLLEILGRDIGRATIAAAIRRPLDGPEGGLLLRLPALASAGGHASSTTPRTPR